MAKTSKLLRSTAEAETETEIPIGVKRKPPRRRLSFEEFVEWLDEDTWAEWVDGEVVVLSPASRKHQEIFGFLLSVLHTYVKLQDLGVVLAAPFLMKLPEELRRGREPDLLFVAKEHLDRLKETYLDGPADLVMEIVSKESRLRDRGDKRAEYEAAGIPEYWLIDPERREVELNRLDERGRYRPAEPDEKGYYASAVIPGFRLKAEWLWQEPLPSPLAVLAELLETSPEALLKRSRHGR